MTDVFDETGELNEPTLKIIGKGLRVLRKSRGHSQNEVAGIGHPVISTIENGRKEKSIGTYNRIAKHFDMSVLEFFKFCLDHHDL